LIGGFLFTSLSYLVLLCAPPRMEFHEDDTIFYLAQAHDLITGRTLRNHHYPTGYAQILAMAHVDLGRPWSRVVAINLSFLTIGFCSTFYLLQRALGLSRQESAVLCLLSLWSWMLITFSTRQLPEVVFFGVSTSCLLVALLALESDHFWIRFASAVALAGAAIWIRSIGVALAPGLLFVVMRRIDRRHVRMCLPALCVVGACIGLFFRHQLMTPNYSQGLTETLAHPVSTIGRTTLWRIREIGEIAQNASPAAFEPREQLSYEDQADKVTQLPEHGTSIKVLAGLELRAMSYVAGAVFLLLIVIGFIRVAINVVGVYLLAYGFILLLWPFGLSRFFVPLVPFIMAYGWLGLRSLRFPRWLPIAYMVLFCLCGAMAMGNEWSLALHGREQSERSFDDMIWVFQHRMGVDI
jgi:MFS family permease